MYFDVFISACLSLIRALEGDISNQFARANRAHAIETIGAELIGRDALRFGKNLMTRDIEKHTHTHSYIAMAYKIYQCK